jgi:hypothetical protein
VLLVLGQFQDHGCSDKETTKATVDEIYKSIRKVLQGPTKATNSFAMDLVRRYTEGGGQPVEVEMVVRTHETMACATSERQTIAASQRHGRGKLNDVRSHSSHPCNIAYCCSTPVCP